MQHATRTHTIGWVAVALALGGCAGQTDDSIGSGGKPPAGNPIQGAGGGANTGSGGSNEGGIGAGSAATGGSTGTGGSSSGGVPSGGAASGGAASGGAPGSSGDPCEDCVVAKCGAQISACNANPDCVAMGKCFDACTDDACFDTCYDSHPAGQALDDAIFDCVFTGCANECQF